MFSYDIVRIVIAYTNGLYTPAKAGAQLQFLFKVDLAQGFSNSYCVAISPHDDTIWCGGDDGCRICTPTGQLLRYAAQDQCKCACTGIVFDNDNVFIADFIGHRIVVCRPDGSCIRSFGSLGAGAGQFRDPFGIAADGQGLLFVTDSTCVRASS